MPEVTQLEHASQDLTQEVGLQSLCSQLLCCTASQLRLLPALTEPCERSALPPLGSWEHLGRGEKWLAQSHRHSA